MDTKRRSRIRVYPIERAPNDVLAPLLFKITTKEKRQNLGCIHTLRIGLRKITRPVIVHDTLHRTRLIEVAFAFEFLHSGGHSKKLRKMPARRTPSHTNPTRIHVVLRGMRSQPSNCGLTILNSRWKGKCRRKSVGNRERHISPLRERQTKRVVRLAFAGTKPTTMNTHDRRKWPLSRRLRHIQLQVLVCCIRKLDTPFKFDPLGNN